MPAGDPPQTRARRDLGRLLATLRRHVLGQFVLFSLVGGLATVVYLAAFNLLRSAGVSPLPANTLAATFSTLLAFLGNRRFTFPHAAERRPLPQFLEFGALVGLTLLLTNAALVVLFGLMSDPSRLAENLALLIATGCMFVIRFLVSHRYIFSARSEAGVT